MRSRSLLLLTSLCLSLIGCTPSSTPSGSQGSSALETLAGPSLPEPPRVVGCEPGIRGGRLIFADFGDPKSFKQLLGRMKRVRKATDFGDLPF